MADGDDSLPRVAAASLPSFDLVVATVGRAEELGALVGSLQRQSHPEFRLIVVDQSGDDRLVAVLAQAGLRSVHLRSERGLARARNIGLRAVESDLVGFPDDDCAYPPDLLERLAYRFAEAPMLDGLTGRTADLQGQSASGWATTRLELDRERVWHGGNSATTFLRAALARRIGPFDEALGLGAGTPWSSGEDTDYLVRALDTGAQIEYDPSIVVVHPLRSPGGSAGSREGAAVGYLLGKHRYPPRTVARMLVRPLGGAAASLALLDLDRARFRAGTFRGRVRGYRAGRKAA